MKSALELNAIELSEDQVNDLNIGREKALSYMSEGIDQFRTFVKGKIT